MNGSARRIPALLRRGGRSPAVPGGAPVTPPPVNTVAPVASGTVVIGNVLSTTDGTWDNVPTSFTYQWQRDGVDIGGATANTYTVVSADIGPGTAGIGTGIRCRVTASNAGGSSAPAASNALAFNATTYLPTTAIGISTAGLTLADSNTTIDQWASSLGGLSQTLTAPAAADRPAYSATGGTGSRPLATFDGSSDVLRGTLTKGSAFTTIEFGFVGGVLTVVNNDALLAWQNTNTRLIMITGATARAFVMSTGSFDGTVGALSSTRRHHSIDAAGSGGASNYRVGGTIQNSSTTVAASIPDASTCALAALVTASSFANIDCQAWYFGARLTADQRTHLRALLTYHTGVSC